MMFLLVSGCDRTGFSSRSPQEKIREFYTKQVEPLLCNFSCRREIRNYLRHRTSLIEVSPKISFYNILAQKWEKTFPKTRRCPYE